MYSSFVWLTFFLAQFLLLESAGLYSPNSNVISLSKTNFALDVLVSDHVWLVEFYAPWCGHCKRLAPEWEKAATNLKGLVKVGAINCDEEKELCGSFSVQGFPTIKVFPSEQSANPYQKGLPWKTPVDYNQARTAGAIVSFALSQLPAYLSSVTAKTLDSFLNKPNLAKVLLFTDKPKTTALYKALSVEFKGRLLFGEVRNTETELVGKYQVKKYPTLLVVTNSEKEESKTHYYEGKLAVEELTNFLSQYAAAKSSKFSPPPQPPKPAPAKDEPVKIHEVNDDDSFDKACLSQNSLCVIAFLDPNEDESGESHTRNLETFRQVGEKHKRNFRFLWVNGPEHYQFAESFHLASGFPSLIVLSHKKSAYTPFIGVFEKDSIGQFLVNVLSGKKSPIELDKIPALSSTSSGKKAANKEEL